MNTILLWTGTAIVSMTLISGGTALYRTQHKNIIAHQESSHNQASEIVLPVAKTTPTPSPEATITPKPSVTPKSTPLPTHSPAVKGISTVRSVVKATPTPTAVPTKKPIPKPTPTPVKATPEPEKESQTLSFAYPISKDIQILGPPYKGSICTGEPEVCETVTYNFGDEFSFMGIIRGIDFAASPETPVYASESGTVGLVYKNENPKAYSYVMVVHKDNFSTIYGYLESIDVQKDQKVTKGQKIGSSGTGPLGPRFHFEIRLNSEPVNPTSYLGDR